MSKFVIERNDNSVWFGRFEHLSNSVFIRHGISTRLGGLSQQPFSSLNLGLHTGDDANKVNENRARFCQAIGVNYPNAVTAQQNHGDNIAVVSKKDSGRGARSYDNSIANTDALITNTPDLPLLLFFADCVPVLIADPVHNAVGISHAGWKGTVAKIAQKTLLKMQENYNTNPADCLVGIGPSIGPCCYEVDAPVIDKLKEEFSEWDMLVTPRQERWHLDLWAANRLQLQEIGVKAENIVTSNICTSCNNELFFSHRAEHGRTGRIGAVISLTQI